MARLALQTEFRPALPTVYGAKDYQEFRLIIENIDNFITQTGIEHKFIADYIEKMEEGEKLSVRRRNSVAQRVRRTLRYGILRALTGHSIREIAIRAADSDLFRWFTYTSSVDGVRPLSKSAIDRMEKMFSEDQIVAIIHNANLVLTDAREVKELLLKEEALSFKKGFGDTTCVKANIHFPVDWVLLRDAARTLIKAIIKIRKQGLKHRISEPEKFLRDMNKLCIEMTHTRKKANAKMKRKMILRRMKRLSALIEKHGWNYYTLLEENWEKTDWSKTHTTHVLKGIKNILDQLPAAVKQAHERMIGERRVANKDKILSLYEENVHVLVRGKSGAEVEFGNGLYLVEQEDGLIFDWEFLKDQPPADSKLIDGSIARITQNYGSLESLTTDRGFDSPANRKTLEELNIFNAICPRSVPQLKEKLKDEEFCLLQKRRGSTEARIGIFKNAYLGSPLKSKGFKNRKTRIEWCILAHNLWKIAVMMSQAQAQEKEKQKEKEKEKKAI